MLRAMFSNTSYYLFVYVEESIRLLRQMVY